MDKRELKKQIEEATSLKEKMVLEGRLIKLLKMELKQEKNLPLKQSIKIELYEELKKHRETIKNANQSKKDETPISETLGLKIKSIANTIDIFQEKHDVLAKLEKAGISTGFSVIFALGLEVGLTALTGGTIALPTLARVIPTAAYIGLSNLLRIPFQKTKLEEALRQYESRDEESKKTYKFVEENVKNNTTYLELLEKQKECLKKDTKLTTKEQIEIYEKLIEEEKKLEEKVENIGGKYLFNAEILARTKELSLLYSKHVKEYITDKEKMTTKEFIDLEKKSLGLDVEIFNRENHLKESSMETMKNITISTGIMYATRIALSAMFPNYGIKSLQDALTPFMLSIINNTCNLDDVRDKIKLKEAKYVNQYLNFYNKNKAEEILKKDIVQASRGAA